MSQTNNPLTWNITSQQSISSTRKKSFNKKHASLIVLSLAFIATLLFFISPNKTIIPIAFISINTFFILQIFCRECLPNISKFLVPFNLAYLFFFIQLVIIPLTIAYWGIAPGNLPWFPSTTSVNAGLAIYTLGYVSFALSFEYFSYKAHNNHSQNSVIYPNKEIIYPKIPIVIIGTAFVIIGLLGLYFFFGSFGKLVSYLNLPNSRFSILTSLGGTLVGALSGLFRPFLSFGIVLLWSYWFDKYHIRINKVFLAIGTGIAIAGIIISGLAFSYNRASFLVPLIAMMAAFYNKGRKLSARGLIFVAILSIGYFSFVGIYRNIDNPNFRGTSVLSTVQNYGAAPQYIGFFIEQTGYGHKLYWGSTLIASALYPVPILGREFRPYSGVRLYNFLIYQNTESVDAILPLQGELFANFHIFGIIIGYVLIGYLVYRLNRAFMQAKNSFENFSWFVISYWVCYMVLGSLAIFTQQLIVAFWPFYVYCILKAVNHKSILLNRQQ